MFWLGYIVGLATGAVMFGSAAARMVACGFGTTVFSLVTVGSFMLGDASPLWWGVPLSLAFAAATYDAAKDWKAS